MLTKKEIKRFKALLQKNDDDLTEEELEELDELEEKMNSDSDYKPTTKSKNNKESEDMPEWAKKLLEKFDKREPKPEPENKPIKVPVPPKPEPEEPEPEEPEEPDEEQKKKKKSFFSWLI